VTNRLRKLACRGHIVEEQIVQAIKSTTISRNHLYTLLPGNFEPGIWFARSVISSGWIKEAIYGYRLPISAATEAEKWQSLEILAREGNIRGL